MKNIVGVKFKELGKIYFFDSNELNVKKGSTVIVDTEQGEEYGKVIIPSRKMPEDKVKSDLKKVLRFATYKDEKEHEKCKKVEKEAYILANKKIKEHNLDMNLSEVEYRFDNSKMIFYFTAEGRIDFRDLVRDLAAVYRTRIELRQMGVRDEVKRIGGNGVCGRELCCCSFLNDFDSVSIKMAKEQNVSLNPSKISGNCGRLMCCLKYEDEVYTEKLSRIPEIGTIVTTQDGKGEVDRVEILKEIVRVKIKDGEGYLYKKYNVSDIKVLNDKK